MFERDALLASVVAEPDADAPRLVYADWLEENPRHEADTARAQFIRLEIEAESLVRGSLERAELERAAAKLFNEHHKVWDEDIPTWGEWYDSTLIYRRGFPYELRTVFRKLALSGGRLFDVVPIQSLSITSRTQNVSYSQLIALGLDTRLPDLRNIRHLIVGPGLMIGRTPDSGTSLFRAIADYPTLGGLQSLSLARNELIDVCVLLMEQAFRTASFHGSLKELDLSDNRLTAAGATSLAAVPALGRIERIILTGNPLGTEARQLLRNRFGSRVLL